MLKGLYFSLFIILILSSNIFAQNDTKNMELLKTRIHNAYDIFNSYSYDNLNQYVDENMIEHSPDPGQAPGLAGLKEAFKNLKTGFPDYKFTINDIVTDGEKAAVLFTFTGTNSGNMNGMKATNKKVEVQGIDWVVFKNGKATEHWGYLDSYKMMDQLGMSKDKQK